MATFHINRNGTNLGTFSEDEVRDGLRSGKFFATDLGWREGGLGEPLIYAIIGGSVGGMIYFLYNFLLGSAHVLGSHGNPMMQMMGGGIRPLFFIILVPLFVTIGAFISSGIFHLCLMIVG